MSQDSYAPSSSPLQETWNMSQQHYYEYKRDQQRNKDLWKQEKENNGRPRKVKQEHSSPCTTPRASAIKTNILLEQQYGAAWICFACIVSSWRPNRMTPSTNWNA
ncbi:hypothetical protein B0H10DRAFT_883988 [Mycena sp. CBHHK59/15]|nr:hypothetical protein B0H10DRAFT_883988 [Mycena sp. CBHHK59/15]